VSTFIDFDFNLFFDHSFRCNLLLRRYYIAVCFPQLFDNPTTREDMVARAIGLRINLGHSVSTSNPAVLLKNLLAQQESRLAYASSVSFSPPPPPTAYI
jgi:hypothetical protein